MGDYVKTFDEWAAEIKSLIQQAKDDGVMMYIPDMCPDGFIMYRGTSETEVEI